MRTLGFPEEFVSMIKLLFQNAQASIKVNGDHSPTFSIQRGVQENCPLAPYLFLIMVEVLNSMVKLGVAK